MLGALYDLLDDDGVARRLEPIAAQYLADPDAVIADRLSACAGNIHPLQSTRLQILDEYIDSAIGVVRYQIAGLRQKSHITAISGNRHGFARSIALDTGIGHTDPDRRLCPKMGSTKRRHHHHADLLPH